MAIEIKDLKEFQESLKNTGNKLIVVDFFVKWCSSCKMIAPKLDEYAEKFGSKIKIIKVDVEEFEGLSMEYNISNLPTLVFIKEGTELDRFSGTATETIEELIAKHIESLSSVSSTSSS